MLIHRESAKGRRRSIADLRPRDLPGTPRRGVPGGSLRILLKAEPLAPPPRSNVLTVAVLSTPGSAGKAAGWAVRSGAGRAACQPAGPARAGVAEADTAGTDRRGRQRSGHARPDLREPAGSAVG